MNQFRRSVNFIQPTNFTFKKLRSELYRSGVSNNYFENLSNEIFYEIFDYLDGCDIYKAFSYLNKRFENLLSSSSFPIRVDLGFKSNVLVEHRCRHVILPNKHRLLSLHLRSATLIDEFFKYCTIDSSFTRLESVVLSGLTDHKLLWILCHFNSLPRLHWLSICMEEEYYDNLGDIYRLIFSLPALKYNRLSLFCSEELSIVMPNVINQKFSAIKYLNIDYSCTTDLLVALLRHTPQLCSLICEQLIRREENVKRDFSINLSHLRYISISECYIDFDEFEAWIKTISSSLQVLSVNVTGNVAYLNAHRWEQLIEKHIPHLNKFCFKYEQYIDPGFNIDSGYTIIDQFTSPFWLRRKWFSELKLNCTEVFFSIHPPRYVEMECLVSFNISLFSRKEQFDSCDHTKTEVPPIRLTIEANTSMEQTRSFINRLKSSGIKAPLTYLNLSCNKLSNANLIEIIRLLPHLHFLEISSLTIPPSSLSSFGHIKSELFVSMNNRIIKVKLHHFTGKQQLQYLIDLFSHLQYLEIGCTSNTDLGTLVKYVLTNQMAHTPNLNFVCLNVPNADEKMIKNVATIIDLETLVKDYTIQRFGNKIFLQWKFE